MTAQDESLALRPHSLTDTWGPYLDSITIDDLRSRVRRYQQGSRKERTPEQIRRELYAVLTSPTRDSFPVGPPQMQSFSAGQWVYRVRPIRKPEEIRVAADVWNPPSHAARPGRLNKANESLLYTALAPDVALDEARIEVGDMFALSQFEVTQHFTALWLGEHWPITDLTLLQSKKKKILDDFLLSIFSARGGLDDSHRYVAPELLVKDFYDLPSEVFDGWIYRSIPHPGGLNLAFRPDSGRKVLKFLSVHLAYRIESEPGSWSMNQFEFLHQEHGGENLLSALESC